MKSVAAIFFSLLATALTAIAAPAPAPAPAPALEVHQAHGQDRPVITTPTAVIPLRLLDRDGNYTHTLEPRAIAVGDGADNTQQQFTFRADEDAPYMVCSRIPRAQAGCVVRVWFDSHGVEEEGRPDDGDAISSSIPRRTTSRSLVSRWGVDNGDGRGEQGLMVRKIDVDCP
ncbi:hypothetical protein PG993_005570 [Apiospora rasikravindrae]|uniref:Uncharacterized protein n=1 Tax=Apiospora rasikravindrae TaxID=990691 RepID=A0ABR1THV5_9PEZI